MKCKFCGSTKTKTINTRDMLGLHFGQHEQLLHTADCIAQRTEKELLLLILEKLDDFRIISEAKNWADKEMADRK